VKEMIQLACSRTTVHWASSRAIILCETPRARLPTSHLARQQHDSTLCISVSALTQSTALEAHQDARSMHLSDATHLTVAGCAQAGDAKRERNCDTTHVESSRAQHDTTAALARCGVVGDDGTCTASRDKPVHSHPQPFPTRSNEAQEHSTDGTMARRLSALSTRDLGQQPRTRCTCFGWFNLAGVQLAVRTER